MEIIPAGTNGARNDLAKFTLYRSESTRDLHVVGRLNNNESGKNLTYELKETRAISDLAKRIHQPEDEIRQRLASGEHISFFMERGW